jgi:hypothetical protein
MSEGERKVTILKFKGSKVSKSRKAVLSQKPSNK